MTAIGATSAVALLPELSSPHAIASQKPAYDIAAYYFGNYHVDQRNEASHGPGWSEWRLVQDAKPRFPGHVQPKVPLWGFEDESNPLVFEKKVDAATKSGLTAFIFDWYWYNDGPFLQGALEQGFLRSRNRNDLQFAIMWANHDWVDIQPAKLSSPPHLQYPGRVSMSTFDKLTDHIIAAYFALPNYWKLDGRPYFSIYEFRRFVDGLGGMEQATDALTHFRAKAKAAGFPDLHLNIVTAGVQVLPGQTAMSESKDLLDRLNVDSTTSYVWIHHAKLETFPTVRYEHLEKGYEQYRDTAAALLGKPYFPNVSMGWDSTPRACQSDIFVDREYPFLPVVEGNTPEAFGAALRSAKLFLDRSDLRYKVLTINSWNEWTEGSYLEPDTRTRYGYLDQIARVFPPTKK